METEPHLDPHSLNRADLRVEGLAGEGQAMEAWDVTVVHPLRLSNASAERAQPGVSAAVAETMKTAGSVATWCKGNGVKFRPLAFETTGALGKGALAAIKALISRACLKGGEPRSTVSARVMQGLQVVLAKGCADVDTRGGLVRTDHSCHRSLLDEPAPPGNEGRGEKLHHQGYYRQTE